MIECVVKDFTPGVGARLIDFDKGILVSPPVEELRKLRKGLEQWILESGIDAAAFTGDNVRGLTGWDMIVIPVNNKRWNISSEDLDEALAFGKLGRPSTMSGNGNLPATYLFKTGDGGRGVL